MEVSTEAIEPSIVCHVMTWNPDQGPPMHINVYNNLVSPQFSALEIGAVFGIKNMSQALKNIHDEDRCVMNLHGATQNGLKEDGLYCLIAYSRKETAKQMIRWVLKMMAQMRRDYIAVCAKNYALLQSKHDILAIEHQSVLLLKDGLIEQNREQNTHQLSAAPVDSQSTRELDTYLAYKARQLLCGNMQKLSMRSDSLRRDFNSLGMSKRWDSGSFSPWLDEDVCRMLNQLACKANTGIKVKLIQGGKSIYTLKLIQLQIYLKEKKIVKTEWFELPK